MAETASIESLKFSILILDQCRNAIYEIENGHCNNTMNEKENGCNLEMNMETLLNRCTIVRLKGKQVACIILCRTNLDFASCVVYLSSNSSTGIALIA